MEEFEVKRCGILIAYDPYNKMSHLINKGLSGEGIGHERFENCGSVWAGFPRLLSSHR